MLFSYISKKNTTSVTKNTPPLMYLAFLLRTDTLLVKSSIKLLLTSFALDNSLLLTMNSNSLYFRLVWLITALVSLLQSKPVPRMASVDYGFFSLRLILGSFFTSLLAMWTYIFVIVFFALFCLKFVCRIIFSRKKYQVREFRVISVNFHLGL